MYIKGGMKKLSKAIAKSAKTQMDAEIAKAEKEEKEMMAEIDNLDTTNPPVLGDEGIDNMSVKEKIGTWGHNFSQLEDKEKFYYMLEQGRGIVELDEKKRVNGYRVYGCVSQVWVLPSLKDEKMIFEIDADSHEARGVCYILKSIFSGGTPSEILEVTDDQIVDIGFYQILTPKRRDGLFAVVNAIRTYAKDMVEMLEEAAKAQE